MSVSIDWGHACRAWWFCVLKDSPWLAQPKFTNARQGEVNWPIADFSNVHLVEIHGKQQARDRLSMTGLQRRQEKFLVLQGSRFVQLLVDQGDPHLIVQADWHGSCSRVWTGQLQSARFCDVLLKFWRFGACHHQPGVWWKIHWHQWHRRIFLGKYADHEIIRLINESFDSYSKRGDHWFNVSEPIQKLQFILKNIDLWSCPLDRTVWKRKWFERYNVTLINRGAKYEHTFGWHSLFWQLVILDVLMIVTAFIAETSPLGSAMWWGFFLVACLFELGIVALLYLNLDDAIKDALWQIGKALRIMRLFILIGLSIRLGSLCPG